VRQEQQNGQDDQDDLERRQVNLVCNVRQHAPCSHQTLIFFAFDGQTDTQTLM